MKGENKSKEQLVKELEKLRQRMTELKKKYYALVDNAPIGVYTSNLKGDLLYVNKALLKMAEFDSVEDMSTVGLVNMYKNPEDREILKKSLRETGKVNNLELELYTKTKKVNNVLLNAVIDGENLSGMIIDIGDRKRIEKDLKESEERFKELWDDAPIAYHTLDKKGIITSINQTEVKMLGYTKEEMLGKSMFEFILPEQRAEARRRFRKKIADQKIPRADSRIYVKKDGTHIYVAIDDVLERDSIGKVVGVRTTMVDITERIQADEALKQSEEKYREIVENINDALYIINKDGVVTYISPVIKSISGYSPSDIIGRYFTEFIYKEDIRRIVKQFKKVISGRIEAAEYRILTKKGEIKWVRTSSRPILHKNRTVGLQGIMTDITDRKRTEGELRESEDKFRRMFNRVFDAVVIINRNGMIMDVNDTTCKLLGYSKEEILKLSVGDIHPQAEIKKIQAGVHRVLKKGIDYMGETAFVNKNGETIQVEAGGGTFKIGDEVYIMGSFRNITERKLAEDKLIASLEEKEVLLREIHHRVKNNMQVISSLLRLQSRSFKDDMILEKFKVAQNRIRSMALIHESLYKARDLARINLSDYVSRLTTHLRSLYKIGKGTVKFNLDIKDINLDISKAIPCGLIISEVMSNSLKHAFPDGRPGEIQVKGSTDKKGKCTLVIKDTGVGIPGDLDLYQTDTLGMQLVTDLVKQLGGTIKLDREGGTSFIISFRGKE